MNTLELKHLAPYLPYGLKAILSQEGKFNLDSEYPNEHQNKICTITDFTTYSKDLGGSMRVDGTNDYSFDFDSLSEIIIALRPLSDLTKEIEVNCEKFVAGLKLVDPDNSEWDKMMCEEYNAFPKIPKHGRWIQVKHSELGQVISINPYNIEHLPYHTFKKLLEWHFDVFGLIEQGLAIDLNTIKNG